MQQGSFIDVFLAVYVWAYVPGTCRAKNTSIKLPRCMKLAIHIILQGINNFKILT